jgi:hypothetical protein
MLEAKSSTVWQAFFNKLASIDPLTRPEHNLVEVTHGSLAHLGGIASSNASPQSRIASAASGSSMFTEGMGGPGQSMPRPSDAEIGAGSGRKPHWIQPANNTPPSRMHHDKIRRTRLGRCVAESGCRRARGNALRSKASAPFRWGGTCLSGCTPEGTCAPSSSPRCCLAASPRASGRPRAARKVGRAAALPKSASPTTGASGRISGIAAEPSEGVVSEKGMLAGSSRPARSVESLMERVMVCPRRQARRGGMMRDRAAAWLSNDNPRSSSRRLCLAAIRKVNRSRMDKVRLCRRGGGGNRTSGLPGPFVLFVTGQGEKTLAVPRRPRALPGCARGTVEHRGRPEKNVATSGILVDKGRGVLFNAPVLIRPALRPDVPPRSTAAA